MACLTGGLPSSKPAARGVSSAMKTGSAWCLLQQDDDGIVSLPDFGAEDLPI